MSPDQCPQTKHAPNHTRQNVASQDDTELIAYYEQQRNSVRSDEWVACLDATIRQLRQS